MTHPSTSARRFRRTADRGGFTLIELLVVVAIIALVIGILVPTLGSARQAALLATEQADARAIAQGYAAYAGDNKDYVLPAKVDSNKFPDAVVRSRAQLPGGGEPIGPHATRWIWRLGPYVDFSFRTLIRDPEVLAQVSDGVELAGIDSSAYRASVFTGFGLNSYYIGGRREFYETNAQGVNRFQSSFGADFFVRRLSRAPRPASLLAFVSSASNIQGEGFREGYFYVEPPRTTAAQAVWVDFETPTQHEVEWLPGWYGAFPIAKQKAVANFLDGHADQLEWDELTDMRHWAPQANSADWQLEIPGAN